MNFEITPHTGIGPVKLGMSQEEIKAALGVSSDSGSNKSSDYYFANSLQVEFSEGKADFIGLSYSDEYIALYQGKNVFDIEAPELFRVMAQNESGVHKYDAYEYLFPEQILTLWDADEQYDRIGGEERVVWGQLGLGSKSYLKAVG
ncbi:MAG: hypothetical protein ACI9LO_002753 [Planctomycetota bacterium]|jgi:hypothetical protein